jgi:hypothetical protein
MQATTIVCPGCHRAMALKQPPPPGARLGCPACGTVLPTPAGGNWWAASPQPVAPAPIAAQPRPRAAVSPVPAPKPVVPVSETPAPSARAFHPVLVVSLIAGVFLLVAGGSLVLYLILDAWKKKDLASKELAAAKETTRTPASQVVSQPTEPSTQNPPRIIRPPNDDPEPVRAPPIQPSPPSPVHGDGPPPQRVDPPPVEKARLPNEDQEKVNKAIEKGLDYLTQNPVRANETNALGIWALVGLTFLECGIPATDDRVQRAATFVRANAPNYQRHQTTYEISLCLLFLDRLGDPKDEPLIMNMGLRLVAGQGNTGGWAYTVPLVPEGNQEKAFLLALRANRPRDANGRLIPLPPDRDKNQPNQPGNRPLNPADRPDPMGPGADPKREPAREPDPETVRKALAILPPALRTSPSLWGPEQKIIPPSKIAEHMTSDNSNTQFAALALWVAARHGVPIDRAMLLLGERFRISQSPEGGWGYQYYGLSNTLGGLGAMTGAGLLGLAEGHGVKPDRAPNDRKAEKDEHIEAGLRHLGTYVGNPKGPERMKDHGTINVFFLWTLQRVAVLYNLDTLNGKDWYAWGAELLVDHQEPKGCWSGSKYPGSEPTVDTCFALLFLKRTNLIKDLSKKLEYLIEAKDPGKR